MKYLWMNLNAWLPVFLAPVIMLTACHWGNKKNESKRPAATVAAIDSPLVNKATDIQVPSTETYVAGIISRRLAIEHQLPGTSATAAALLYQSLALYVDTALTGITSHEAAWLDQYVNYYSEAKGAIVAPPEVQKRINLLATAGIEPWGIGEGYTDLRTVPTFYTALFKTSLPPDYTAFLQLQADEDTVLYSADAGLMVPFSLVGKRALNWEQFQETYPNSIFVTTARELYEQYCEDYLFGEDNTPSFDTREINSLLPENKETYLSFVQEHGDTKTGGLVKIFLDKLSTEKSYDDLRRNMRAAIEAVYPGKAGLLPDEKGR